MTYKEFVKWCNDRACDGCWGSFEARSCINFIYDIEDNCKGIFKTRKKEKMFHELYEETANTIVNATNKRIEELLNDN